MNIYSQEGDKVVFVHPNNGFDSDKVAAAKYLINGNVYTVDYTVVHSWSTDVYLKEIPNIRFNSVHFEDVEEEIKNEK